MRVPTAGCDKGQVSQGRGRMARRSDEARVFVVGDRETAHEELADVHTMDGALVGGGIRGAHQERTSGNPCEIRKCGQSQNGQYSPARGILCTRTITGFDYAPNTLASTSRTIIARGALMEISDIKRRVVETIERARRLAGERRTRIDEAAREYEAFLDRIAIPVFKQVANVLRVEGYMFTVFTPGGGVRLMSDRAAEDYVELELDTTDEPVGERSRQPQPGAARHRVGRADRAAGDAHRRRCAVVRAEVARTACRTMTQHATQKPQNRESLVLCGFREFRLSVVRQGARPRTCRCPDV